MVTKDGHEVSRIYTESLSLPSLLLMLYQRWLEKWPSKSAFVRLAGEGDWSHQFKEEPVILVQRDEGLRYGLSTIIGRKNLLLRSGNVNMHIFPSRGKLIKAQYFCCPCNPAIECTILLIHEKQPKIIHAACPMSRWRLMG